MILRLLSLLALATAAFGAPVSGTITTDVVSAYTFRGVHLGGTSIQPALTLQSPGSLYATVWSNQTLRASDSSLREVDFTLGAASKGGLDGGLTVYTYPGRADASWEPYLGYGRDLGERLKASLYVYRDLTVCTTTAEAKATVQLVEAKRAQLSLEGALGTVRGTSSYTYWSGGPVVKASVGAATLTAGVAYTSSNETGIKRDIWVTRAGVGFAF